MLLCFAFTCRSELARFVTVFGDAFAFGQIPRCVDGRIFGVKANAAANLFRLLRLCLGYFYNIFAFFKA
jgi:hypothetical protein